MKTIQSMVRHVFLNPLVLLAVAIVAGGIGSMLLLDVPTYTQRLARVERLTPITATSLATSPQDREILIEGRISANNPKLHRDFVAYVREEYRDEFLDGDTIQRWVEVKRETPPLLITLADGEIRLANNDYLFDTTAVTIEEAAPTITKGAIQTRGYTVNSPVMLIGQAEAGGRVHAEFVYAGSRAAYITELRSVVDRSLPIGLAFMLVSMIAIIAGVREIRRFLREIAAEGLQYEVVEATIVPAQSRPRRKKH
jgi:hypothetical protein